MSHQNFISIFVYVYLHDSAESSSLTLECRPLLLLIICRWGCCLPSTTTTWISHSCAITIIEILTVLLLSLSIGCACIGACIGACISRSISHLHALRLKLQCLKFFISLERIPNSNWQKDYHYISGSQPHRLKYQSFTLRHQL